MKTYSMTEGKIAKAILYFAFPILIGNVFQQLYNVIDTAIIGNVLGDTALAAVGASAALYSLVINFANGITNGFAVVLARFFGAKDEVRMREGAAMIYGLTFLISVVLTLLSVSLLHPILVALNTPADIIDQTDAYIRIILNFSMITMLYNMFAGMLRAVGNSRTPLYFLIVSSFINGGLDWLFVAVLGYGIEGAAYATVIAQGIAVLFCFIYVWRKCPPLKFSVKYLKWKPELIKELLSMGLSMGLMIVVVCIGSVALQSAVNSLGKAVIAAHIAARKIDEVFMMPLSTLSSAASTFASQNLGAKKYDRIQKGIKCGIGLAEIWSLFSILCTFVFGYSMAKLLTGTTNQQIVDTAFLYMRINIIFFPVLSVLLVLRSSLQGVGRKLVPVLGSVVELIFKFAAVEIITEWLGYFGVCILEPIIWTVCALLVFIEFLRFTK